MLIFILFQTENGKVSCFIMWLIILLVSKEEITPISLPQILKVVESKILSSQLDEHPRNVIIDDTVIKINLCTQTFSYDK